MNKRFKSIHRHGCQEEERRELSDQDDEDVQSSSDEPPSSSVSHSTAQLICPRPSNYFEGMIIKMHIIIIIHIHIINDIHQAHFIQEIKSHVVELKYGLSC